MDWRKGLTKAEKAHLRETGATTRAAFRANRTGQRENDMACHECRKIALKLGIET